MQV
jgi:hypothetical protein